MSIPLAEFIITGPTARQVGEVPAEDDRGYWRT